eukprot:1742511-Alexandrium_andersonii.AAC.1
MPEVSRKELPCRRNARSGCLPGGELADGEPRFILEVPAWQWVSFTRHELRGNIGGGGLLGQKVPVASPGGPPPPRTPP